MFNVQLQYPDLYFPLWLDPLSFKRFDLSVCLAAKCSTKNHSTREEERESV